MKILIVDPDHARAPVLQELLTASGAEVSVAPNGSFALTMLEWNAQDVIVSCAFIEDMDGHELCGLVRADPSTKDIRFVLIASAEESAGAATAAAGIDLVLPSSMTASMIAAVVVQLVQHDLGGTPAPDPPESAPVEVPEPVDVSAPVEVPEPVDVSAPVEVSPFVRAAAAVAAPRAPAPKPAPPAAPPAAAPARPAASPVTSPVARPKVVAAPLSPVTMAPHAAPPPPAVVIAPGVPAAAPIVIAPVRAPAAPAPAPVMAAPPASRPAATNSGGSVRLSDLDAVGAEGAVKTFQGSLGAMEMQDLVQAISTGGKTGRLLLVLAAGGGMIVFAKGKVVHAEFGPQSGEPAFAALVSTAHRERSGKFCFIPSDGRLPSNGSATISKSTDQLLLSIATAIEER